MVNPAISIALGAGVAGFAGGVALDRRLADTPSRVAGRLPQIARRRAEESDELREGWGPPGTVPNALLLWLPVAGTVLGVGAGVGARHALPVDRIWSRHPAGIAAIALTAASAGMALGAGSSRIALG